MVEFGERIKSKAITAGGLNSAADSRHFSDQAERYASGNMRDLNFYRDQLDSHTERSYQPGQ